MSENERIAREVLASTREAVAPYVDPQLLEKIYSIEIKYQFAKERAAVSDLIRNLVDECIQNNRGESE